MTARALVRRGHGDALPNDEGLPPYAQRVELFDIRYAQKNYRSEAERAIALFDRLHPSATSLLDVGCGTGRHLEFFAGRYRAEGLDLHPGLLALAQARVPSVALHQADMCGFRLEKTFDIITCLFAAIALYSSPERMRAALARMAGHLSPEGVLCVEPFLTPGVYREGEVVHNLRDDGSRKLSWMYVMRRAGSVAPWEIHWLIGERNGQVVHLVEREEWSLFETGEYLSAMADAGLCVVHHPRGLHGYGAFFARRRPWSPADRDAIDDALGA